ncbi:carboxymuconolactone decarboxylase family protein [Pseudonocardia sp. KRD-176]|nr:carboxymuconolactone decarboxylase family protein [Pseudonocardia oceani]
MGARLRGRLPAPSVCVAITSTTSARPDDRRVRHRGDSDSTRRGSVARLHAVPPRLVELVRLRIAFHNQCRSCMALRTASGAADGVTEDLVCSLEEPQEAPDLTGAEKAALRYADLFATDHLAAGDAVFDLLRTHFGEPEIVELGVQIAVFVGFGRLSATWDVVDDLPERFHDRDAAVAPWGAGTVVADHR